VIASPFLVDGSEPCYCGKRRGLHRYGDECCPNPRWKCGNGEDQWWTHRRFVALPPLKTNVFEADARPSLEPITG
jgi:hypothetical protein